MSETKPDVIERGRAVELLDNLRNQERNFQEQLLMTRGAIQALEYLLSGAGDELAPDDGTMAVDAGDIRIG